VPARGLLTSRGVLGCFLRTRAVLDDKKDVAPVIPVRLFLRKDSTRIPLTVRAECFPVSHEGSTRGFIKFRGAPFNRSPVCRSVLKGTLAKESGYPENQKALGLNFFLTARLHPYRVTREFGSTKRRRRINHAKDSIFSCQGFDFFRVRPTRSRPNSVEPVKWPQAKSLGNESLKTWRKENEREAVFRQGFAIATNERKPRRSADQTKHRYTIAQSEIVARLRRITILPC